MYVVEERNGKVYALPAKDIKYSGSPLAGRILSLIARKPASPKELAQALKENEQKVYYHVRQLERKGMIKVARKEERGGAVAKYYALAKPALVLRFSEMKPVRRVPKGDFPPFIEDGVMNAKIIVGSPDPHGPERARSRDAYYAIDLALFFGTFLMDAQPAVYLDTEIRGDDLKENLIVIGGPVINKITAMINDKMPVKFDKKKNIYSAKTKKTYKSDDAGLIINMKNPFDSSKQMLVIAGKRYSGTRAAILAIIKHSELLQKNNAIVVQGLDRDYDGIVDDVEILE